jgi:hypothetical protein
LKRIWKAVRGERADTRDRVAAAEPFAALGEVLEGARAACCGRTGDHDAAEGDKRHGDVLERVAHRCMAPVFGKRMSTKENGGGVRRSAREAL